MAEGCGEAAVGRVNFVVKLLRAHGGCLGRSRRRRTWQAAISLGEPQTGFDPGISEWGNPVGVNALPSRSEFIAPTKLTGGSEPSQYPQEEKAKAIPSVAASERGSAQTVQA